MKRVIKRTPMSDAASAVCFRPGGQARSQRVSELRVLVFEDAATDSPGAEAVVPAAKLDGVNETLAADHRRNLHMNQTGEEACEKHDLSRQECWKVGCCQWAACPITSTVKLGGQCHSAASIQNGQCTSVPWESHEEDGPYCWADIKDNHVDGCRRGFWGFLGFGCGPCEGDCDNDYDCQDLGRSRG